MRRVGAISWPGGKGQLLGRLLPLIPEGGRPYTEAYFGAGWVLLNRPPAPSEAVNDLDERIVNLFRTLQDRCAYKELLHRLRWTPYARAEFERARELLRAWERGEEVSGVDLAWAFVVAQRQSFGGTGRTWGTVLSEKGRSFWGDIPKRLSAVRERIMRVQIDRRDALDFLRYWDTPEAVHYVDPPYHPDTTEGRLYYRHNADHAHHEALVSLLLELQGAVVLSGYRHAVHEPLEASGWLRIDIPTVSHMAGRIRASRLRGEGGAKAHVPRMESVWLNPKAQGLLRAQGRLL